MEERRKHSKTCKLAKERTFDCEYCNEGFILDDSEFEDLKNKHKLKVNCPNCHKNVQLVY